MSLKHLPTLVPALLFAILELVLQKRSVLMHSEPGSSAGQAPTLQRWAQEGKMYQCQGNSLF